MTITQNGGKRLPWDTPQLRRIEAGSAEAVKNSGIADGGVVKGQDKS